MNIKTRKFWCKFFLILGLLSIVNMATKVFFGLPIIIYGVVYISRIIIGDHPFLIGVTVTLLDLALVWLLLAWILRPKKVKQQEDDFNKNEK